MANVPDGTYEVVAHASGLQEFRVGNMILTARENRRIDIQMSLGSVGQSVQVSAGATLIETDTARVANTTYESCSSFRYPEAFATLSERLGIPGLLGPAA